MAELMIAVVILGIGLLITSSMFPIAWLKARDVAEMTALPACTESADMHMRMLMNVNGDGRVGSSFLPGDWFYWPKGPSIPSTPYLADIYPDTWVHHLNAGNYLANGLAEREAEDWLDTSLDPPLVADNTWSIDSALLPVLQDFARRPDISASGSHHAKLSPHVRMYPPLDAPPPTTATAQEKALWEERFQNRRYVWSVFYRMSEMPGLDPATWYTCKPPADELPVTTGPPHCATLPEQAQSALRKSRMMNVYYFTLKRPVNARYARQEGYRLSSNDWDSSKRPHAPRALPADFDVALPVPWRIEAELTDAIAVSSSSPRCAEFYDNDPNNDPARTGIASEIKINDLVIADIVQSGTVLLDELTGEVFRVTSKKQAAGSQLPVTLVLDKEYDPEDICLAPLYSPDPADSAENYGKFGDLENCVRARGDPRDPKCKVSTVGNKPSLVPRRFYWVFPPPVDTQRGPNGAPIFNGSQPVVGVEVRQMMIDPNL